MAVLQLGHGEVVHAGRDGGHVDVPVGLALALGVDGGNGPAHGSSSAPHGPIIHERPRYHATIVNSLELKQEEEEKNHYSLADLYRVSTVFTSVFSGKKGVETYFLCVLEGIPGR